jgi:hypothetical protein
MRREWLSDIITREDSVEWIADAVCSVHGVLVGPRTLAGKCVPATGQPDLAQNGNPAA